MTRRPWWYRSTHAAVGVALTVVVGCAAPQGGSAVAAGETTASGATAAAGSVAEGSGGPAPSSDATTAVDSGPVGADADGTGQSDTGLPAISASVEPDPSSAAGSLAADVETGPGQGILSPTGDLTANIVAGSVCFAPAGGVGGCGSLAPGAPPTFAAFSPDGSHLLIVAGTPSALGAYVFDVADASVRVLGPAGLQDFPPGGTPPLWDLSTAAWNVDGSAVVLVPTTTDSTGPVLTFDLGTGTVAESLRVDALLVNNSPSIWTTATGIALVTATGEQRNILWWADFASGTVSTLANYPEAGGSLALAGADPLGGVVLICPRRADGALGAISAVVVQQDDAAGSQAVRVLPDSLSCAGSVFSADGRYLAVTAKVDGQYQMMVIDRSTGATVLRTPLSVAVPSAPPYLTWLDDVIVVTDVSGEWATPTLVLRTPAVVQLQQSVSRGRRSSSPTTPSRRLARPRTPPHNRSRQRRRSPPRPGSARASATVGAASPGMTPGRRRVSGR